MQTTRHANRQFKADTRSRYINLIPEAVFIVIYFRSIVACCVMILEGPVSR